MKAKNNVKIEQKEGNKKLKGIEIPSLFFSFFFFEKKKPIK